MNLFFNLAVKKLGAATTARLCPPCGRTPRARRSTLEPLTPETAKFTKRTFTSYALGPACGGAEERVSTTKSISVDSRVHGSLSHP